jgi:hypothetical protein
MIDRLRLPKIDNGGRRLGFERRKLLYTVHIPERRSGLDRTTGKDRRNGGKERRHLG